MRRHVLLIVLAGVFACSEAEAPGAAPPTPADDPDGGSTGTGGGGGGMITDRAPFPDAGMTPYTCEVGVPDDLGDWTELPPGGDVPIGGAGQSGLTAQLALRLSGVDPATGALDAVVQLVLENVATGVTGDSRPWDLSVRFECDGAGRCDRAPVVVEVSHLAKLPELEGTAVAVRARALDPDDPARVLCQASSDGVLARR